MSSSNETLSETTALLADSRPTGQPSLREKRCTFSPETLLIPVALATSLAAGIPSTTLIELMRQAVCKLWNALHGDPATLILSTPERCDAPEIARYFAIVLAVFGVIESVISITVFGIFSRISSNYGRKPAFLVVLIPGIVSSCAIAGSQYMPDWLAGWVFLVGMLSGVFSSPLGYLIDMYIVDGCAPDDRTAALSKISGWGGLGTCVSFALGGFLTTRTGNPVIVFHMATAIYVATFIYIATFLPESFSEEKRTALSNLSQEPSNDARPTTTRFAFLHIFEPLKMLVPTRRLDGTCNWRLVWCAAHIFIFMVAHSYAWSGWLVFATSIYHLTPADTGLFLTIISISRTVVLMVIVPPLIRFLRPYYHRQVVRTLVVEEDTIIYEEEESETSDHLYVHLAVGACAIAAVSLLGAAVSTTAQTLMMSAIVIGFASVHGPTVRSLVAGSVDPLKQGEALAAIEMVTNASRILSPIVMGSILTATIETTPLLLFYVHMVVVLISSSLLFLVRDADRYQKPHET